LIIWEGAFMSRILIGDIETNAIHMPHSIWMVGVLDWRSNEFTAYHGDNVVDGLLRLAEADVTLGHNWRQYDVKNIERMTDRLVTFDQSKIIDTLELSRKLCKLKDHKLKTWGEMFGFPKGDYTDFSRFRPEMIEYCKRDCEITKMVFDFLNELAMEKGRQNLLEGLI
jgi:DNA polymerase III alpha subunit (gram-positive type)